MKFRKILMVISGVLAISFIGLSLFSNERSASSPVDYAIIAGFFILTIGIYYWNLRQEKSRPIMTIYALFVAFLMAVGAYLLVNESDPALFFIALLGVVTIIWRYRRTQKRSTNHYDEFGKPLSRKLLAHYRDAGLTDTEIDVFRDTMAQTKSEIIELDKTMRSVPKLRSINLNHDTINLAKALFAALVKEPARLQESGDFIYKHLPNSVQIAKKYAEINQHELKTADTYAVLDRSVEMLASLSEQIKTDYLSFVEEDVNDLTSTLDSINKHHDDPDFGQHDDQTLEQMQDQLAQIQTDYLKKNHSVDNAEPKTSRNDGEFLHDSKE